MFTQVETDYLRGLINSYYAKGYKYYLAHTITENNSSSDYDMCVYFSKEKIEAVTDTYFEVRNGVQIYIDSTSKGNYNYDSSDKVSGYSKHVEVDQAEFIYTNAICEYDLKTFCLNPDPFVDYSIYRVSIINVILLGIVFSYLIIRDLFFRG